MINIAYVIDQIWNAYGGTEKQLLLLLNHLDKTKIKSHLICLRNTDWLDSAELPCPVLVLGMTSLKPVSFYRAFKKFKKYCRDNDIDIVQTFFRDGNLFGTIAAFLSGIKVIVSSRRNYGAGYWHNRLWIFVLRILGKITSHYICNSTIVANYTIRHEKISEDKVSVIYNGLMVQKFENIRPQFRSVQRQKLGIAPDNILIGAMANLRPIKNLTLFVEVASKIYRKYRDTRFIIIGEGPDELQLEKLIADYNLEGIFRLEGLQENVLPYLAALDIGVLCSKSESLSNTIIEYMASGLPSVVSQVGGNHEAIGNKFGLIFENDNSEDFCNKLEILINDDKLRKKLGQEAYIYCLDKYDLNQSMILHEKLYEEVFWKKQNNNS